MDGLIVLQPFANQIINGKKKYEYRSKKPPVDKFKVPLFLLSKGYALGKFMIIETKTIKKDSEYGWKVKVLKKFKTPRKYKHPMGAQIWVKNVKLKVV